MILNYTEPICRGRVAFVRCTESPSVSPLVNSHWRSVKMVLNYTEPICGGRVSFVRCTESLSVSPPINSHWRSLYWYHPCNTLFRGRILYQVHSAAVIVVVILIVVSEYGVSTGGLMIFGLDPSWVLISIPPCNIRRPVFWGASRPLSALFYSFQCGRRSVRVKPRSPIILIEQYTCSERQSLSYTAYSYL